MEQPIFALRTLTRPIPIIEYSVNKSLNGNHTSCGIYCNQVSVHLRQIYQ